MKRISMYVLGIAVMAASLQVGLGAIPPVAAPEIDPGSAVSALGLLTGGVMVLRARWRR
jgi:hypothetical protein